VVESEASLAVNALLILDKDSKTMICEDLRAGVVKALEERAYRVEVRELGRQDAYPCLGCLRCFTEHPGECVRKDAVNEIRKKVKDYSATIYLTPVLFGHFSSTIANAMNRGTGSHRWQVVLGFGQDIADEERSTFIDLTARHRGKADIVHPGMDTRVDVFVTRSLMDNASICEALRAQAG
jgi:multimeric flavodoxin WrbA